MMISLADEANDPGWMSVEGRRSASDMERTARFLWGGWGGYGPFQINPTHLWEKFFLDRTKTMAVKAPPDRSIGAPNAETQPQIPPHGRRWHRIAVDHLPLCCAQHRNL